MAVFLVIVGLYLLVCSFAWCFKDDGGERDKGADDYMEIDAMMDDD